MRKARIKFSIISEENNSHLNLEVYISNMFLIYDKFNVYQPRNSWYECKIDIILISFLPSGCTQNKNKK